MTNLLITGAGVDRTTGIDFPLANTLLADLAHYLENEGKEVNQVLRSMLPKLQFKFNTMIKNAVDKITVREPHEQREMVQRVQDAIANLPNDDIVRKHGDLIIRLFNKLATIAEESQLDEETEQLIREIFPRDADNFLDSDSILDIHKLSLSDTFKEVLKRTLRMGLTGEYHAVANALGAELLNIETLLVEKFFGFYSNKLADIKNYLYISWALWAFLVEKQKQVFNAYPDGNLPFYSNLPNNIRAITLNYTSFLQKQLGNDNVIYFHGGLAEYVRMDTRNLMPIENILESSPQWVISNIVQPNINVSDDDIKRHRHVIPALVPPLRIKPVLSNKYIDLWANASKWVQEAEHIVVVGYSFNSADEHFNDILRQHSSNRRIDIVVPNAGRDDFKERMNKVFQVPIDQFCTITVQDKPALKCKNLRLISAKADEIEIAELFQ